jgi:hypothetical protein
MDAANDRETDIFQCADASIDAEPSGRTGGPGPGGILADEIDRLRQIMADTFVRESSFTADPVVRVSKQLDVKINEYMRQSAMGRKKVR